MSFSLNFFGYPPATKCQFFSFSLKIKTEGYGLCHISKYEASLRDGYLNLAWQQASKSGKYFFSVSFIAAPHFHISWNKHPAFPQHELRVQIKLLPICFILSYPHTLRNILHLNTNFSRHPQQLLRDTKRYFTNVILLMRDERNALSGII